MKAERRGVPAVPCLPVVKVRQQLLALHGVADFGGVDLVAVVIAPNVEAFRFDQRQRAVDLLGLHFVAAGHAFAFHRYFGIFLDHSRYSKL